MLDLLLYLAFHALGAALAYFLLQLELPFLLFRNLSQMPLILLVELIQLVRLISRKTLVVSSEMSIQSLFDTFAIQTVLALSAKHLI